MAVHQDDGRAEIGKIALGFSTHNLDGEIVPFPGRAGPFLCLLTFIDCDHCATRLSVQDSEAAMIAEKEGVDVIDILVYATPNDGRNFVKLYPTPSREVLCDSSGWIVKNQLGGTHEECWILLDRAGRIVHRSDADLDLLREAINGLKP
jgi:hypothetical protein